VNDSVALRVAIDTETLSALYVSQRAAQRSCNGNGSNRISWKFVFLYRCDSSATRNAAQRSAAAVERGLYACKVGF